MAEKDNPNGSTQDDKITRRECLKILFGLRGKGEDASLLDTVKLSAAYTLVLTATAPAAIGLKDSTGINIGNAGTTPEAMQWGKENPVPFFLLGALAAPIYEEGIFRIMPSLFSPRDWGTAWRVGIPSSIAFAEIHGLAVENLDTEGINKQVKQASIPVYQFLSGMFLWKLARDRGYLHAIVAHSVINTILFTVNLLLPSPQEDPVQKIEKNPSSSSKVLKSSTIPSTSKIILRF